MEYENIQAGVLQKHALPERSRWPDLFSRDSQNLLDYCRQMLLDLCKSADPLIDSIARCIRPQLRDIIQDPAAGKVHE